MRHNNLQYRVQVSSGSPSHTRSASVSVGLSLPLAFRKMALVPFSYASPFADQLQLAERLFTIDGRLLRIRQVESSREAVV